MNDTNKKRVLSIDDDQDILAYLQAWLGDHGFTVDVAHDGNEALERMKQNLPDLITLDIVMPQKTGVKFFREIKKVKEYANIPVIVITGLQSEFESFISHRRTAPPPDAYLSKPFDKEELLKTINTVMGKTPKPNTAEA
jgi:DNA-binding response OmpR family regulator